MHLGSNVMKSFISSPPRGTSRASPPPKISTFALEVGSSASGIKTAEWEFRGAGALGRLPNCRQTKVDKSNMSTELLGPPLALPPKSITYPLGYLQASAKRAGTK